MTDFTKIRCSEFASMFDTAHTITLATALERLSTGYYTEVFDFQQKLDALGLQPGTPEHTQAKRKLKTSMTIPALVLSAIIREGEHRSDSNIEHMSGLVCHDFDLVDQHRPDFHLFKQHVRKYPFVAYCGASLSRSGYFTISLTDLAEKGHFKPTYEALATLFQADGWVTDKAASSLSNYRYASFDSDPYINTQALPFPRVEPVAREPYVAPSLTVVTDDEAMADIERIIAQNPTAMISDNRNDWVRIGFAFANDFGERGRPLFHHFSALSPKYDAAECDHKYNEFLRSNRGVLHYSTFYYLCEKEGISLRRSE